MLCDAEFDSNHARTPKLTRSLVRSLTLTLTHPLTHRARARFSFDDGQQSNWCHHLSLRYTSTHTKRARMLFRKMCKH